MRSYDKELRSVYRSPIIIVIVMIYRT